MKQAEKDEDGERRRSILNILLIASVSLFAVSIVIDIFASIQRPESHEQSSFSIVFLVAGLVFFLSLYLFSKKGFSKWAAFLFLLPFFLLSAYISYIWGVDAHASILIYVLLIVMSGILISKRSPIIVTLIIGSSMLLLQHLHDLGIIPLNSHWKTEIWHKSDTTMVIIIFLAVAVISWLSNREIEKSLERARNSEAALLKERDMLEETVAQRTKELREAEAEKISQLYRFAEFGRLSSGLFHDLMNPLTALSLNMQMAKNEKELPHLEEAVSAAKKMQRFIEAIRKQISGSKGPLSFSLRESAKEAIGLLSYKARLSGVEINLSPGKDYRIAGEELKWNQIVVNLLNNAIDACENMPGRKEVKMSIGESGENIVFKVEDTGSGISRENMDKIFEPFFTTKEKGVGIGLSMTKNNVINNFGGRIEVFSGKKGSTFKVFLPKKISEQK